MIEHHLNTDFHQQATDFPGRIIVMGASTGGFEAFKKIIHALPPDFQTPIFIVWHMSPDIRGLLPDVLNKVNSIPAAHARDNEMITAHRIYVAPPDHHLIINDGKINVTHGPKENRFRPAIDPLFRSAAYEYHNRVIGIILSGALDDGTAGLWRIKSNQGIAIAQDPTEAEVASMPENASRHVALDYCLRVADIAPLLVQLCNEKIPAKTSAMKDDNTKKEIDIAAEKYVLEKGMLPIGELSPFTCPECHGVLSKITDGELSRYRCHTGHAYSIESLMTSLTEKIEQSLYDAIRGVEETVILLNHIGDHYAEDNQPKVASLYFQKAREAEERSRLIRKNVFTQEPLSSNKILHEAENTSFENDQKNK